MTEDVITPLQFADLRTVADIHAACFDDGWGPMVLRRILSMPGAFGISSRRGGHGSITGFALGRIAADECELLSLGVAPGHRRRGLGAMLLDAAMGRAIAVNASRFFLEVAEDNEAALNLYAGRGMDPVGRRPNYYELKQGGYAAALTMRCDLQAAKLSSRTG